MIKREWQTTIYSTTNYERKIKENKGKGKRTGKKEKMVVGRNRNGGSMNENSNPSIHRTMYVVRIKEI